MCLLKINDHLYLLDKTNKPTVYECVEIKRFLFFEILTYDVPSLAVSHKLKTGKLHVIELRAFLPGLSVCE